MFKRASVLKTVIALIMISILLFVTACTEKKDSSEEIPSSTQSTAEEKSNTEGESSEELSVDEEFSITIDENQGVDGF